MSLAPRPRSGPLRPADWPKHLLILGVMALELFPLYLMLQMSLKDNAGILQSPWLPGAPADWRWENWLFGLRLIGPTFLNTLFVAVVGTAGSLAVALLGAYFFARGRMPFADVIWSAFLVLILLPSLVNLVPLFLLLKSLSLLNTLWALVGVGIAAGQAFNIFVLRNFIADLPRDLFEAAEMDGASHLQRIRHVVIPLSGPILGTLAVLSFLGKWNDFLLPLIVLRDRDIFTVGVGLIYLDGESVKHWGRIMAAYSLAAVPLVVLFAFTMRLFVRGFSVGGAIKG